MTPEHPFHAQGWDGKAGPLSATDDNAPPGTVRTLALAASADTASADTASGDTASAEPAPGPAGVGARPGQGRGNELHSP